MDDTHPFSYQVNVSHIAANPINITLDADSDECAALAQFWNILAVKQLSADVRLSRWKRDGVKVAGTFKGILEQQCVVSLKPVETMIEDRFTAHFVPENSRLAQPDFQASQELVIDIDGPDSPDTFSSNRIDIGHVVAEFAAMNIDPYPKRADAKLDPKYMPNDNGSDERPASPFAALKTLKTEPKIEAKQVFKDNTGENDH